MTTEYFYVDKNTDELKETYDENLDIKYTIVVFDGQNHRAVAEKVKDMINQAKLSDAFSEIRVKTK